MKLSLLMVLGLLTLSSVAFGKVTEQEFKHPKLFGLSYFANDAEEVFGLERLHQNRAREFCKSQNYGDASSFKVKYVSTVKYVKEDKKFKWLEPIEMIVIKDGRPEIREFRTTYHVLSAYRDPAYFLKITCKR